jgi:hypothetical protein
LYKFKNVFGLNFNFEFKFKSTVKKFQNLYLFSQAAQITFGPFVPGSPAIIIILYHFFPAQLALQRSAHSALWPTRASGHSGFVFSKQPAPPHLDFALPRRAPPTTASQAPMLPHLPIPAPPPFPLPRVSFHC